MPPLLVILFPVLLTFVVGWLDLEAGWNLETVVKWLFFSSIADVPGLFVGGVRGADPLMRHAVVQNIQLSLHFGVGEASWRDLGNARREWNNGYLVYRLGKYLLLLI